MDTRQKIEGMLTEYWDIAYSEGAGGVSRGSEAQAVLSNIRELLATHTAELAAREAEIANQALNYVSLFGELQNAMAEIARLNSFIESAFLAHPNLDLDIAVLTQQPTKD